MSPKTVKHFFAILILIVSETTSSNVSTANLRDSFFFQKVIFIESSFPLVILLG